MKFESVTADSAVSGFSGCGQINSLVQFRTSDCRGLVRENWRQDCASGGVSLKWEHGEVALNLKERHYFFRTQDRICY